MPDNDTRRLLDIDVDEVSLVDRAANLRRFLVIKRLEDESMKDLNVEEITKNAKTEGESIISLLKAMAEIEDAPTADFEKIIDFVQKAEKAKPEEEEEEMSKAVDESTIAAIKEVVTWMNKMSKGPGAPTDAIKKVAAFLGKVAGGKYPSPKSKAKPKDEEEKKKGKMEDEDEEKKKQEDDEDKYPSPKGKTKKDDGNGDGLNIRLTAEGDIEISGQTVHKAKKFTSNRTAALKETALGLVKLIAEVDPEATKEIKEIVSELPTDPSFSSGVRPTGTAGGVSLKKEDGESENEKEIMKQLEAIDKRLEKIETERPDSKSLDGQGGTEKTGVKKGLWDGVL